MIAALLVWAITITPMYDGMVNGKSMPINPPQHNRFSNSYDCETALNSRIHLMERTGEIERVPGSYWGFWYDIRFISPSGYRHSGLDRKNSLLWKCDAIEEGGTN